MTWSALANGSFVHAGSTITGWVRDDPLAPTSAWVIQCRQPADKIAASVLADPAGVSRFDVRVEATNIVIQPFFLGVAQTAVDSAAHGLTAGQPFTLDVRVTGNNKIEAYLNAAATPAVDYTVPASDPRISYRRCGFTSDIDGARVVNARVCSLRSIFAERADVLFEFAGGNAYARVSGGEPILIAERLFDPSDVVSACEFRQKCYAIGGGKAWVLDAVTLTAEPFVPSAGLLPGQTTAGTTTGTIIVPVSGRLLIAGIPDDASNAKLSAFDNPLDFDETSPDAGASFLINVATRDRVGFPIRSVTPASADSTLIGTDYGFYWYMGDPLLNNVQLLRVTGNAGPMAQRSCVLGDEGWVIAHTTRGLAVLPLGGAPVYFTEDTLQAGLEFAGNDLAGRNFVLHRDPENSVVVVFAGETENQTQKPSIIGYDEVVGRYQRGAGGLMPETWPTALRPTCCEIYQGQLLIGTQSGLVVLYSDAADADQTGLQSFEPIDAALTAAQLRPDHLARDLLLDRVVVRTGRGSADVLVECFGSRDIEGLFDESERWKWCAKRVQSTHGDLHRTQIAPAHALVIRSADAAAGGGWSLESLQASLRPVEGVSPRRRGPSVCNRPPEIIIPVEPMDPTEPDGGDGPGDDIPPEDEVPCVDVAMWWPSYVKTRDLCSQLTTFGSTNNLYMGDAGIGNIIFTLSELKADVLASQVYADYVAAGMCEPFTISIGFKGPPGNSDFDDYDYTGFGADGPDFVTLTELDALIAIGDDALVPAWGWGVKAPYTKTTSAPSTCPP